ncbi:hypothetical protein ES703_90031 [subsurface metagenome]
MKVTVVHATPHINLPLIKASGLLFIPEKPPISGLDIDADRVARELGLGPEHRRTGAVWACFPNWTETIDWFVGLGLLGDLSVLTGEKTGIVAFEVDAERTYAYNFKPLWQEEETEYAEDFDKAARAYWRSATLLRDLVGKPEPWPGNTEILVRGPMAPWRLRMYLSYQDFLKAEGR